MHYTISKKQIEQAIDAINTGDTDAARMLQGILAQPEQEPVDLDFARAMCRGAGISLVSRDFIERFADFVGDWKKGDFILPKYAELDMQSCFDAWQAFDPDLAIAQPVQPPAAVAPISADDVTDEVTHKLWNIGLLTTSRSQHAKETVATIVNAWGAKQTAKHLQMLTNAEILNTLACSGEQVARQSRAYELVQQAFCAKNDLTLGAKQ
jgi:hypothetical protein